MFGLDVVMLVSPDESRLVAATSGYLELEGRPGSTAILHAWDIPSAHERSASLSASLHVDLIRGEDDYFAVLHGEPEDKTLLSVHVFSDPFHPRARIVKRGN